MLELADVGDVARRAHLPVEKDHGAQRLGARRVHRQPGRQEAIVVLQRAAFNGDVVLAISDHLRSPLVGALDPNGAAVVSALPPRAGRRERTLTGVAGGSGQQVPSDAARTSSALARRTTMTCVKRLRTGRFFSGKAVASRPVTASISSRRCGILETPLES
eukprot:825292-Prymnesium_polylepis.2